MSRAESLLADLLHAEGVRGWEREWQFDRRERGCECQRHRYADHPTEAPGIIRCEVTDAPLGHVPGKRKPWVKCKACNGRGFVTTGRKWALDFAWPDEKVAVEVEGITSFGRNRDGSMRLGRHQTAKGFEADCEKYSVAALKGWAVLRVTPKQIKSGEAMDWIRTALEQRREE